MALERIILRNFQAHKKLALTLDPGVTTIVGPSDVGKSAVLRALRWVAENRPNGGAFRRHGTNQTRVTLVVDGHTIHRKKGKGANCYVLDGACMQAFGTKVPAPVVKLLNLADVSWQGQHDSPFWFARSAGEVSRLLNQIVDLSVMDAAVGYLTAKGRRVKTECQVVKERLAAARAALDATRPVLRADRRLQRVEALGQRLQTLLGREKALEAVVTATSRAYAEAQRLARPVKAARQRLQALDTLLNRTVAQTGRWRTLSDLLRDVDRQRKAERHARTMAKDLSRQFNRQMGRRCPLCQMPNSRGEK